MLLEVTDIVRDSVGFVYDGFRHTTSSSDSTGVAPPWHLTADEVESSVDSGVVN